MTEYYAPQQQQQQQQFIGNLGFNPQQIQDAFMKSIEPLPVIEELQHYLRGDYWDDDLDKWINYKEARLMNDKGVKIIISLLRSYLNSNIVQGNLTMKQINMIMRGVCFTVVTNIRDNYIDWEIEKTNFDTIHTPLKHSIFIFLTRPKDDGERKRWMKQYSINETSLRQQDERDNGFKLFNNNQKQ